MRYPNPPRLHYYLSLRRRGMSRWAAFWDSRNWGIREWLS